MFFNVNNLIFYRVFWNKMYFIDRFWFVVLRSLFFFISFLGIFYLLLKYSMCYFIIFIRYFLKFDSDKKIVDEI